MKIKNQLKQIRKSYLAIEPPSDFKKYGWLALRKEIEVSERRRFTLFPVFTHNVVFTMIIIFLLAGTSIGLVKASQGSLPGDTLYPLKRLSETVVIAISGDKQVRVEKRAEDVVGVAEHKNDLPILKKTVEEYQKAVSETKREVEKSGKKEEFQDQLKKQEEKLRTVSKHTHASEDLLIEAIEAAKRGREDDVKDNVKGIEHQKNPSEIKQEIEKSGKIEEIIK